MHAPGTLLADQFGGDWEAYLTAIEDSDPQILALGVTDYFGIQTYREVRKRKACRPVAGRRVSISQRGDAARNQDCEKSWDQSPSSVLDDPQHETTIERILGRLHFRFQEQGLRVQ